MTVKFAKRVKVEGQDELPSEINTTSKCLKNKQFIGKTVKQYFEEKEFSQQVELSTPNSSDSMLIVTPSFQNTFALLQTHSQAVSKSKTVVKQKGEMVHQIQRCLKKSYNKLPPINSELFIHWKKLKAEQPNNQSVKFTKKIKNDNSNQLNPPNRLQKISHNEGAVKAHSITPRKKSINKCSIDLKKPSRPNILSFTLYKIHSKEHKTMRLQTEKQVDLNQHLGKIFMIRQLQENMQRRKNLIEVHAMVKKD